MNKIALCIIFLCSILLLSCSPVDSDAREAAEAVHNSLEMTAKGNLREAEIYFKEYQKIDNRYKGTENYAQFREAYQKYLSSEN